MFIVSGKFDIRRQQRQLIINNLQTLIAFEEQKIANANQIIIRNKANIQKFDEMIMQSKKVQMKLRYIFMMKQQNK